MSENEYPLSSITILGPFINYVDKVRWGSRWSKKVLFGHFRVKKVHVEVGNPIQDVKYLFVI